MKCGFISSLFLDPFLSLIFWSFSFRMDPSLLRERELFKKRALSTPAVEKRPTSSDSGSHKKKKPKVDKESSSGSKVGAGKTCRTCYLHIQSSFVPNSTASCLSTGEVFPLHPVYGNHNLYARQIATIPPGYHADHDNNTNHTPVHSNTRDQKPSTWIQDLRATSSSSILIFP